MKDKVQGMGMRFLAQVYRVLLPAWIAGCSVIGRVISGLYKNKIPLAGLVFDTRSPEISPVIKAELYMKLYEMWEIDLIRKHLPDSFDVIELGSSIGVVSSVVKKRLGKGARMICVEAHPELVKQTETNLKLNCLYDNVECLNKAIHYPRNGSVVFFTPGLLSRMGKLAHGAPRPNSISVETVTLSELKRDYGIKDFTLIADIEGVEAGMIREDKEALKNCQHLFLELHDTTYRGNKIMMEDMLKDLIDVHGFCLQDRQWNVVYMNRRNGGG